MRAEKIMLKRKLETIPFKPDERFLTKFKCYCIICNTITPHEVKEKTNKGSNIWQCCFCGKITM